MTRRALVATTVLALAPADAFAQALASTRRPLSFQVWRQGQQIGRHSVGFETAANGGLTVRIQAEMLVKFGPVPVFRYRHDAVETWRDGQFARLESHTLSNGKVQAVVAQRGADGVSIEAGAGRAPVRAPASTCPLTHWNAAVLEGALFNPQTGARVHERVERSVGQTVQLANGRSLSATRYGLAGDAEITDWYEADGAWAALRAKAPDGSWIDYRREA